VTVEEVQKHASNLLSNVHMTVLVAGNMYKDVNGTRSQVLDLDLIYWSMFQ
jgi:hypothetical protein